MSVHRSAEEGYAAVSADYEKGRPEYAPDPVAYLLQRLGVAHAEADKVIVDLAAGTGKFTRALVQAGVKPVALEPVAHMRETFRAKTPGVEVIEGTAESIPLDDNSVDALTVAQAFHWFDGPAALAEIHRVLKPLAGLGLVWNRQDLSLDWVYDIWTEVDARRDDTPNAWSYEWKRAFQASELFSPLISTAFRSLHPTDREGLVARVTSISFVAAGSEESRNELIAHVHRVCDDYGLPEKFDLPLNCYVHWCRAV